jgi:hypothetical protein
MKLLIMKNTFRTEFLTNHSKSPLLLNVGPVRNQKCRTFVFLVHEHGLTFRQIRGRLWSLKVLNAYFLDILKVSNDIYF